MLNNKEIEQVNTFVKTLYDSIGNINHKAKFHSQGKKFLTLLARDLHLVNYEIRSNKGGSGINGDVVLHDENVYIAFYGDMNNKEFMVRKVKGLKDYIGGLNNFIPFDCLRDYSNLINKINNIKA